MEQMFDVLEVSETKLKGKGECEFDVLMEGCQVWTEVEQGKEEVSFLMIPEVRQCVVEWKKMSPM